MKQLEVREMRLRKRPGVSEKLAAMQDFVYQEPAGRKGKWQDVFGNGNPLHLELGTGKGSFLNTLAAIEPMTNYVGMEKAPDIMYFAAQRFLQDPRDNLRFILGDAEELPEYFEPGEIGRIYLNFSDPWPKSRHAKRRLTHPKYLKIYQHLLAKGGEIHLKTDNPDFFEYSLECLNKTGFSLGSITYDLHNSGFDGNIMTEYELRFVGLGQPIFRLEAFAPDREKEEKDRQDEGGFSVGHQSSES
jgi:tRNA (guanine-N7-)-methyltransferase